MPFTSTGLVIGAFTHVSWAAFALGAAGGLLDGVARSDRLRTRSS